MVEGPERRRSATRSPTTTASARPGRGRRAAWAGCSAITEGLQAEFGAERVFDTPLAEAAIAGVSFGLALAGWRPIAEMQFDGFSYPALDQVDQPRRQAPLPRRGDGRRCRWSSASRSPAASAPRSITRESPETYYAHTAGLKVVVPSSPLDAYSLLRAVDRRPRPGGLPGAEEPVLVEGGRRAGRRRAGDRRGPESCARGAT